MKKILVINGSPHKERSTTFFAAEAFVRGLCDFSNAEAEFVHVEDLNIHPCLGCLSCWGRTEGICVIQNDDIPALKDKILQADVIIECFPLYFFGMPGTLKVLTDRMLSMALTYEGQSAPREGESAHGLRYYNPKQSFVVISSCAYTETDRIYDPLRGQLDLVCGKGKYTPIFLPQLKTLVDKGGSRKDRFSKRMEDAGREFAEQGNLSEETLNKLTRPPFTKDIYRTIIRNVFDEERKHNR